MHVVDLIDGKWDAFWKEHLPQSDEAIDRRHRTGKLVGKSALVVLTGVSVLVGGEIIAANNEVPHFSDTTVQFVAQEGDSLWTAAEHVKGHEAVDMTTVVDYIEHMPENQTVLSDGLQLHEAIDIPESVQP